MDHRLFVCGLFFVHLAELSGYTVRPSLASYFRCITTVKEKFSIHGLWPTDGRGRADSIKQVTIGSALSPYILGFSHTLLTIICM